MLLTDALSVKHTVIHQADTHHGWESARAQDIAQRPSSCVYLPQVSVERTVASIARGLLSKPRQNTGEFLRLVELQISGSRSNVAVKPRLITPLLGIRVSATDAGNRISGGDPSSPRCVGDVVFLSFSVSFRALTPPLWLE